MRKIILLALCAGLFVNMTVFGDNASSVATVGQAAPNFTLLGGDGKEHSLADYKGKFVVLEWTNPGCPFVHKFYDSGAMQKLQKEETAKGVVWLRINSSAAGKEGHQTPAEVNEYVAAHQVAATETLLDPTGKVGHEYGARTTPHMFVINPKGELVYAGGIDDTPSADSEDIAKAKNYVTQALAEAMAGKSVSEATTKPYGCSVKYAN